MDISYSDLRQNLKKQINRVRESHTPLYITSHKVPQAVLISYEDYSSMAETAYLLQNPVMAKRLLESVERINAGEGEIHKLIEIDDDET